MNNEQSAAAALLRALDEHLVTNDFGALEVSRREVGTVNDAIEDMRQCLASSEAVLTAAQKADIDAAAQSLYVKGDAKLAEKLWNITGGDNRDESAPTPSAGTIDTPAFSELLERRVGHRIHSHEALITYIMDWHSARVAAARDEGHITGRRNGVREANTDAAETIEELNTALAAAREQALEEAAKLCDMEALASVLPQKTKAVWQSQVAQRCAEAIRALASQPAPVAQDKPVVQDGYVMVPKVPTHEMYLAACRAFTAWRDRCDDEESAGGQFTQPEFTHNNVYSAMIAAAPVAAPAPVLTGEQKIVAWYDPSNTDPGQSVTFKREVHEKWPHIYRVPLVAASSPAAPVGLDKLADMKARKDAAYYERNQVVAALAKCFPSGVARTAIEGWSEDWHGCVYIDLPTGQASWHFHDSHAHLFAGLPQYEGKWDGHTTDEKYARLAAIPVAVGLDQLHSAIMNLPCVVDELYNESQARMYKIGHRDARHDAAELVAATQAERQEQAADEVIAWLEKCAKFNENGYYFTLPDVPYRWHSGAAKEFRKALSAAIQKSQQQGERSDG